VERCLGDLVIEWLLNKTGTDVRGAGKAIKLSKKEN